MCLSLFQGSTQGSQRVPSRLRKASEKDLRRALLGCTSVLQRFHKGSTFLNGFRGLGFGAGSLGLMVLVLTAVPFSREVDDIYKPEALINSQAHATTCMSYGFYSRILLGSWGCGIVFFRRGV